MGRFFLDNEELERLVQETSVSEEVRGAVYRAQLSYFHTRFGTIPNEEQVHYPCHLAPVVDKAVRQFLERYNFRPFLLIRLPARKGIGAESFFSDGRWLSENVNAIFDVDDQGERGIFYEITARDERAAHKLVQAFTRMVDRQFKNKVLVVHDEVKILGAAEIAALGPDWNEVRGTIDPALAERVDQVVLPFFERLEAFRKVGVAPRLGLLMHGGTGTGKTYLIRALIKHFAGKVTIAHLSADQFYSRYGTPIRSVFGFLQKYAPLVLILEDVEMLARSREALLDNPTVQAFLDIMDGAVVPLDRVMIIATTNLVDQLDPAFKRPGRFDEVWAFESPPTEVAQAALESYFAKSSLVAPRSLVKACGDAGLSYAELRFVATEIIRWAVNNGQTEGEVRVTARELKEVITAAQKGTGKKKTAGFQKFGEHYEEPERYYKDPSLE